MQGLRIRVIPVQFPHAIISTGFHERFLFQYFDLWLTTLDANCTITLFLIRPYLSCISSPAFLELHVIDFFSLVVQHTKFEESNMGLQTHDEIHSGKFTGLSLLRQP